MTFSEWFRRKFGKPSKPDEIKRFLESENPRKWDSMLRLQVGSQKFVDQLKSSTKDEKLKTHVQSMHDLVHGKVVSNVLGASGKPYDIKELPGGRLGCTCQDWRFKGSVTPDYECKHIRAYKEGRTKVASPFAMQMSAFARELAKILSEERMQADQNWKDGRGDMTETPQLGTDLTRMEEPLAPLYQEREEQPTYFARNGILM